MRSVCVTEQQDQHLMAAASTVAASMRVTRHLAIFCPSTQNLVRVFVSTATRHAGRGFVNLKPEAESTVIMLNHTETDVEFFHNIRNRQFLYLHTYYSALYTLPTISEDCK